MNKEELIFVVDDDPVYINILKFNLFQMGFHKVETFSSGKEYLDNLYRLPKLVLLDYQLADANGDHLLTETLTFDPDIIVVMISSQKRIELAVETLKMGAFDYLVKDDSVKDQLQKFMERLEEVEANYQKQKRLRKIKMLGLSAIFTFAICLYFLIHIL